MSETIAKLRPDRDLQCYFQTPSAVAALSSTSAAGFTLSGCWRQQFDWAVVEWNRDNVFEHPQLRNLPDGDLSGIVLSYDEQRINCIQPDSTLYATVEWPSLRIWADPQDGNGERVYYVPLLQYGSPADGGVVQATAKFTLCGSVSPGDLIELAWDEEQIAYLITEDDHTVGDAANHLGYAINQYSQIVHATVDGAVITLTIRSDTDAAKGYAGANGNRLGVYGTVCGGTESWSPATQQFSLGQSPSSWKFILNFAQIATDLNIPTHNIRKMRWTYAADLQTAAYLRSEFSVVVSNWSVTGTRLTYSVAGPGSIRIEDNSTALTYSTGWTASSGNFSSASIQATTTPLATCTYAFNANQTFDVYIGTRMAADCAQITVTIDGIALPAVNLSLQLEDVLIRLPAGTIQPGNHTLVIQHTGAAGTYLYFDFIDLVVPTQELPTFSTSPTTTLATDWDTEHSLALAPERTAWLIDKLGFTGRANHYAGALWFYELVRVGHVYATGTIQFSGRPDESWITTVSIGLAGSGVLPNTIDHLHLKGDTLNTIALAFALRINSGYTSVWATASGPTLSIQSRMMGADGNAITIAVSTTQPQDLTVTASSSQLTGGVDGEAGGVGDLLSTASPNDQDLAAYAVSNKGWRTDLTAMPRINRACRDWSKSFFEALKGYGIEATAAFSMELQHGDPALTAGIAQRYPSGAAVTLTTPALQTNFSPVSLAFWQQAYADMAKVMADAGVSPYLQFGEVQWWYFAYDGSGLPFNDAYTISQFAAQYGGSAMHTISSNEIQPAEYPEEAEFLPTLIGAFTRAIQQFVRQTQPAARFEVLYPVDTNSFPFTAVANLPLGDWTASTLDCLKTENFTFTGEFNLEMASGAVTFPMELGFSAAQSSHLIGISNPQAPWQKEAAVSTGTGLESVVLFALDQYCLIGYQPQSWNAGARSFMIP